MAKRHNQPKAEISIEQAFALSAQVHRELNGYFKDSDVGSKQAQISNKTKLIEYILQDVKPSKKDLERGLQLLSVCRGLIMKKLAGSISQYDDVLLEISSRTTITDIDRYHLALLASVPQSVARIEQRRKQDRILENSNDSYVGKLGDKIQTSVEVIRSNFSPNFGVYFVTGKTADNQVVFFAHKSELKPGNYQIRGTVKAHRDKFQTQLNRVKVL